MLTSIYKSSVMISKACTIICYIFINFNTYYFI